MSAVAELLVRVRRDAGLSQAELARVAGIPASVLNAYERGKRQPGADAFIAIVRAAGFGLRLVRRIDPERNAHVLAEVLDLAESLPHRRRGELEFPPFRHRIAR